MLVGFGKATTMGTYDRFIYGVAPTEFVWDDTWENSVLPEKREPKSVRIVSRMRGGSCHLNHDCLTGSQ